MRALNTKLLRDLRRLWAQAAAIALVLAAGVATLILSSGALVTLTNTRASYYASNRFADIFASATRAPMDAAVAIAALEGVASVEPRVAGFGIADIPGLEEPATLRLISLPDHREPELNRITLRSGRLPEAETRDEAVISETFGMAHGLLPGQVFTGIINGMRRNFRVTGWAISPEFVYAIGPGELMPDARRYGIVWQREKLLSTDFSQRGAFNDIAVKLVPGTREQPVLAKIDAILSPFGGRGAYGRKYQVSHAFLDAELQQLKAMQRILPPIFLLVAAFLVNMTLSRLIALEREQVGLLKAMGYSSWAVARHYVAFVSVIALCGSVIGLVAGWWLGNGLALLYGRFFNFPALLFSRDPQIYGIAIIVAVISAVAGAARAAFGAARLSPAVAMAPPSPPVYRKLLGGRAAVFNHMRQPAVMNMRHLAYWPWRTISGVIGVALAVAILAGSLW
jgi:putative ABC transport system permease protein